MTGSAALDRVLLVALVGAVGVSAARLVVARRRPPGLVTGRDADVAHLVMNLGMAWALLPGATVTAHAVLPGVLGALAAVFAVLLLAGFVVPALRPSRAWHAYHLVAAGVMAWATALTGAAQGPAPGMAGHAMDQAGGAPTALVWLLAAVFAVDALVTALVVIAPRRALAAATPPRSGAVLVAEAAEAAEADVGALRLSAVPHVIMDVAMVAMLLAVP